MSENGKNYTTGQKFYTATSSDGSDKSHLCNRWQSTIKEKMADICN